MSVGIGVRVEHVLRITALCAAVFACNSDDRDPLTRP